MEKLEKLIVKTAVKTVLIILGIFLIVFAVFNFAFPQHMATITESTGNYALAVKYADLRYSYTKDCHDLARCYEDSVFITPNGDTRLILKYGEKFISDPDFEKVCKEKTETYGSYAYKDWVYSKYVVAMFDRNTVVDGKNDRDEAIKLAIEQNNSKSFSKGNPVMSLSSKIASEKDKESAKKLVNYIENGVPELGIAKIEPERTEESGYLTVVLQKLRELIRQPIENK